MKDKPITGGIAFRATDLYEHDNCKKRCCRVPVLGYESLSMCEFCRTLIRSVDVVTRYVARCAGTRIFITSQVMELCSICSDVISICLRRGISLVDIDRIKAVENEVWEAR